MKRKLVAAALCGAFPLAGTAGPVLAAQHGPPGPGSSHNGKCTGKPSDRLGGCK
jgi:hypothetical protein